MGASCSTVGKAAKGGVTPAEALGGRKFLEEFPAGKWQNAGGVDPSGVPGLVDNEVGKPVDALVVLVL
jgi:hypothetical protein